MPVSRLRPGVYVVALDRSWFHTPFLFHRRLIKDKEEIELLKKQGVREVVIDIARGEDVEGAPAPVYPHAVPDSPHKVQAPQAQKRRSSPPPESLQNILREIETARTIHDEALASARSLFEGVGTGSCVGVGVGVGRVGRMVGRWVGRVGRSVGR